MTKYTKTSFFFPFYFQHGNLSVCDDEVGGSLSVVGDLVAVNRLVKAAGAERVTAVAVAGQDAGVCGKLGHAVGVVGTSEDAVVAIGVGAVVVTLVGDKGRVAKDNDRLNYTGC